MMKRVEKQMKNMQIKTWIMTVTIFSLFLVGCGSSSSHLKNKIGSVGYFVESGARNLRYDSVAFTGSVDHNGTFEYYKEESANFYINNFLVGGVKSFHDDGYVFIQDLMEVDRETGLENQSVVNLSRVLLAIGSSSISNANAQLLNNFDMKKATDVEVTNLLTSLGLANVTREEAINHTRYYYYLLKKQPHIDDLSRITSTLCIDVNVSVYNSLEKNSLLSNDTKLQKVDVYMNDIYQGTIDKATSLSRFALRIPLGTEAAKNLDRARDFDITFKTDRTKTLAQTGVYTSPARRITVPSPMLGRWIDSQTREIVYLKDESQLSIYEMKDINQLKDITVAGRYLLRAGIGNVNLFGEIRKLSTDTKSVFKTLDMKIKSTDSNLSWQYRLKLADSMNSAGSIEINDDNLSILYVNGDTTSYSIPENLDPFINDIRAISGGLEIYIQESDDNASKVSKFVFENIQGNSYNFGVLNISDSTLNYNIISYFEGENPFYYYGNTVEDFNDKAIEYNKTLTVCNNGLENMSSALISVEHNSTLFKTFTTKIPNVDGFEVGTCKSIPITFSLDKPSKITDINLSVKVSSQRVGVKDWNDIKRLKVSNETFTQLHFLSNDASLNKYVYSPSLGVVFSSTTFDSTNKDYLHLPLVSSNEYQVGVSSQNINYENAFVLGVDQEADNTNIKSYIGTQDRESMNNTFTNNQTSCTDVPSELGANTLSHKYGEAIGYITYEDIDYFKIDAIPALTNKYTSFKTSSNLATQSDIVLPFYLQLDDTNIDDFIKIFDSSEKEIEGLVKTYNDANQTVTVINDTSKLTADTYKVKLLKGLLSKDRKALREDTSFDISLKKTNMIASGQTTSFTLNDDGSYLRGVSMVQVRDDENKIIIDTNTNLVWQDDNDTQGIVKNFFDAKLYCKNLTTSFSSNWRLPTRDELLTLVDYAQTSPAMHNAVGYISQTQKYWTSSLKYADNESAWFIDFTDGESTTSNNADSEYNVRCVLDSNTTNENFYLESNYIKPNGSEFVSDTNVSKSTYLLWQDDESAAEVQHTFENAIEYCENLTLSDENGVNYSDWRLPNIKELSTIVDDSIGTSFTPAIDSHFENTAGLSNQEYWSSTSTKADSTRAWSIGFEYGEHRTSSKTTLNYTRCVSRGEI